MEKLPLKTYRLIKGYSVRQVADALDISEKTIRDIEKDSERLKGARFGTVLKMCDMYNVTTNDLKM